uniref:Uncharacterized protein n=1 Tax=Timema monikensis TaxID=170555 RepID=A0A7R9ECM8_9NEOP|nr:unnamed protein product [Timema monikensis]
MMIETPYLCVLYVSTAGQQGPGLGTDEEEIVLLVYVVIDMGQNKIGSLVDMSIISGRQMVAMTRTNFSTNS